MSESNEPVTDFTKSVKPSQEALDKMYKEKGEAVAKILSEEAKTPIPESTLDQAAQTAQETVLKGLSKHMVSFQIENMKNLAPLDKFNIGGVEYTRNKITPKKLRELRSAEAQYKEDIAKIVDPELRQDRDWQLLFFKAQLYFGMTQDQFNDTDIEYLSTVIQATELRTQGFRQY